MANNNQNEDVRIKLNAVREVIQDANKQNVHLVLEYYNYDVERTIQAFLDDGAKEALDQWQCSGYKAAPKRKKKTKKPTKDPDPTAADLTQEPHDALYKPPTLNGDISSEYIPDHSEEAIHSNATTQSSSHVASNPSSTHSHYRSTHLESLLSHQSWNTAVYTNDSVAALSLPTSLHTDTTPVEGSKPSTRTITHSGNVAPSAPAVPATATHNVASSASNQPQTQHVFSFKGQKNCDSSTPTPVPSTSTVPSATTTSVEKPTQPETVTKSQESGKEKAKAPTGSASVTGHPEGGNRPKTLEGYKHKTRGVAQSFRPKEIDVKSIVNIEGMKSAAHHKGLEKSTKDLQRQVSSLVRLQSMFSDNADSAMKKLNTVFEEARIALQDREIALMVEMDRLKQQAQDTLAQRQRRAAALKARADRVHALSELEVLELRADIKHFVADRKVDEDMASSLRLDVNMAPLLEHFSTFATVPAMKHRYTERRPSISSLSLNSSLSGAMSPPTTPLSPTTSSPFSPPTPLLMPDSVRIDAPPGIAVGAPSLHVTTTHTGGALAGMTGAKVLAQSDNLTRFESTDMQEFLRNREQQQKSRAALGRARSAGRKTAQQRREGGPRTPAPSASDPSLAGKSPSPEDNQKSRTARRRHRQKEREKEERRSRNASMTSDDSSMTDSSFTRDGSNASYTSPTQPTSSENKRAPSGGQRTLSANKSSQRGGGARSGSPSKRVSQPSKQKQGNDKDVNTMPVKGSVAVDSLSKGPEQQGAANSPRSPRGSNRGRGGARGQGSSRPRAENKASNERHTSPMNGESASDNSQANKLRKKDTEGSEKQQNKAEANIQLDKQETSKMNGNVVEPRTEKRPVRDEFRYNSEWGENGVDLKPETNNNTTSTPHRDNITHSNAVPSGDASIPPLHTSIPTKSAPQGNDNAYIELNGSNNNSDVTTTSTVADALPQRKQRPSRAAIRKPLSCDVIIGAPDKGEALLNGDANEVDQHRWSNED